MVTKQGLKQARQRGAGSVKHHEDAKDDEAARTEVSLPHWPEINHGVGVAKLPEDQSDQTHSEKSCQRLHTPEWIAQPVPLLSLAEHPFPRDHDDDQQRQAARVKTERPPLQLRTLLGEIVRIPEQSITRRKCHKTDRDVDVEPPPPRITVRYPAADSPTHDRRQQGA